MKEYTKNSPTKNNEEKSIEVKMFDLISDTITQYGLRSVQVATLYLTLSETRTGRPGEGRCPHSDGIIGENSQPGNGLAISSDTVLEKYVFRGFPKVETVMDQVEEAFTAAVATWSKNDPESCDQAGRTLFELADGYKKAGDLASWETRAKRALDWCRTHLGPDHEVVVQILNDMGNEFFTQGRHDEAEALHREGLEICRSNPDLPKSLLARLLMNLGAVAFEWDQMDKTKSLLIEAMEILEKSPETDGTTLLKVLCNYANVCRETGDLTEFERVSLKAEKIAKDVWKTEPEAVVRPVLLLIRLKEALGRLDDAERIMRGLLENMAEFALNRSGEIVLADPRDHFLAECVRDGFPASFEKVDAKIRRDALS